MKITFHKTQYLSGPGSSGFNVFLNEVLLSTGAKVFEAPGFIRFHKLEISDSDFNWFCAKKNLLGIQHIIYPALMQIRSTEAFEISEYGKRVSDIEECLIYFNSNPQLMDMRVPAYFPGSTVLVYGEGLSASSEQLFFSNYLSSTLSNVGNKIAGSFVVNNRHLDIDHIFSIFRFKEENPELDFNILTSAQYLSYVNQEST